MTTTVRGLRRDTLVRPLVQVSLDLTGASGAQVLTEVCERVHRTPVTCPA